MLKNKRRWSRSKKVMIVIMVILIVLGIQTIILNAKSHGAFAEGNKEKYSVAQTDTIENSLLSGKKIIFLGSSVTYGSAAKGESFVDYMVKRDGIIAVKEAVPGTTMVDTHKKSYVERIKKIDINLDADAFICQLSTNDATKKEPMGTVSKSFELKDFNTSTVAGAIEYIICYVRKTWNCPVIFYTGTKYDSNEYAKMVNLLLEIQKKWGIGVIDLWNNHDMNAIDKDNYKLFMVNGIHPSRAGYKLWWTPVIEGDLRSYLKSYSNRN